MRNPAFQPPVSAADAQVTSDASGGGTGKHDPPADPQLADSGRVDAGDVDLGAAAPLDSAPPPPISPDATEAPAPAPAAPVTACGGPAPAGWSCIPAGTFDMGSPISENQRESQEVIHRVTISRPFWMSTTEVTRRAWQALMPADPSHFSACGLDCPVQMVSWYESVAYANAASRRDGLAVCYFTDTGAAYDAAAAAAETPVRWTAGPSCPGYRLASESEWEYAARAGSATPFPNNGILVDEDCTPLLAALDVVGWYCGNSDASTHPVGQRKANAWGLFDMHGNVWEWVWDADGPYPSGASTNPTGPTSGDARISRGGAYHNPPKHCRAAVRAADPANDTFQDTGLRLVRSAL